MTKILVLLLCILVPCTGHLGELFGFREKRTADNPEETSQIGLLSYGCSGNQVLWINHTSQNDVRITCGSVSICGETRHPGKTLTSGVCNGKGSYLCGVKETVLHGPVTGTCLNFYPPIQNHISDVVQVVSVHNGLSSLTPQNNQGPNVKPGPSLPSRGTGNGARQMGVAPKLQNDKNKAKTLFVDPLSDVPPMLLVKGIVKTPTGYDITYCSIQCDRSTTTTTTTTTTGIYTTPKVEETKKPNVPPPPPPAPKVQGTSGNTGEGTGVAGGNGNNNGGSGKTGRSGPKAGGRSSSKEKRNDGLGNGGNNGGNGNGGNSGGAGNIGGSGHHYGQLSDSKEKQKQSSQNAQTANNGVNRQVSFNSHVPIGGNNGLHQPDVNNIPPQASIPSIQNSNGQGAYETHQNGQGSGPIGGVLWRSAAAGHRHGHGHRHGSGEVNGTSSPGGGVGGCFSGEMTVQTKFGIKRMDEFYVGDEVLVATSDQIESYQPVEWFYHRNEHIEYTFVTITTASNKTLSLTTNHLLPLVPCFPKRIDLSDLADYVNYDSVFAYKAKPGLCLATKFGQYFESDIITDVTFSIKRGVYSPVTTQGTVVVNGIQSSCYSTVENHFLQYGLHKGLLYFRNLLNPIINLFYSQSDSNVMQRDVPSVLIFILEVAQLVVPSLTYV